MTTQSTRCEIKLLLTLMLSLALAGCAHSKEGMPAMKPSIGSAKMRPDGVIHLQLRAEVGSAVGDAVFDITPEDPRYEQIRRHIGGLIPGEEKPVPPWSTEVKK